ncbi:MAG: hypothetical protein GX319_00125 [Clostridiales bacterium]|mgnify:CR=1 FL=1|jgi:hypothetical protein|nr:hypothetical protein [Clostridiales bacterium]
MGDIIIEEADSRAIAVTVASLFLLIASLAICIYGFSKGNNFYKFSGLMAAFFFFIGFLVALIQVLKERRLLLITMDGVEDCSSVGGYGFISYGEIKEFRLVHHPNTKTIAIILKNRKEFISKLAPPKKSLAKMNLYMKQPAIQIHAEQAKDMDPEDVLTLLQKRLRDYKKLYE